MNIKALLRNLAILAMVLVSGTGLYARGTPNGTWITNAKTGGPVDIRLATNAGQLSANFVNASSVTNYASLIGAIATTKVTQGFDMSVRLLTTASNQPGSAGSSVTFTVWVTNWGNSSCQFGSMATNLLSTGGWPTNTYVMLINNVVVKSNIRTPKTSTNSIAPGAAVRFDLRVQIPAAMGDGSSNVIQFGFANQAMMGGGGADYWPGPLALAPSTMDTNFGGQRDGQSIRCVVRVSGPILRLSKTVNVANLKPYEQMTYTIFFTNAGTAAAQNVVIQDVMPSYTTNLVNARLSTNGAASNATGTTVIGKRVQFNPGNVGAGKWGRILFTVQVK